MGGDDETRGGRLRIDPGMKAACLERLLKGERVRDVAASLGVTPQGLGRARKRDPVFDAGWRAALAASAAAERRSTTRGVPSGQASGGIETRIVPNNKRGLQVRKMRHVKFDEARQEAFLVHFARTGDTLAAAAAAGVSESTVYTHRRKNPAFAAEFQEALDQAYVRLEAEALRQRLAAQRKLRAAMEDPRSMAPPTCQSEQSRGGIEVAAEMAAEFERVMKLLARWDRKGRGPDRRVAPEGRRQVWTFDAAIELLERRLKGLGIAVPPLPPEEAARYDGADGADGGGGGPA